MTSAGPLVLGTAGHVDHGKTGLVRALTGVDTDRLPEERIRGMTIVLGFAPLRLSTGRELSIVDVPGHERLVRVMVAGAAGIDLFLLVVAADDGVMPQTVEHVGILRALGIDRGLVVVSKADLADPGPALRAVGALLPGVPATAASARTGAGIAEVAAALEHLAAATPGRERHVASPAVMHLDRVFTVRGAGTVATGTLGTGTVRAGERLTLLPAGRPVRVRGLQVHDETVAAAIAGQRTAVNLAGVDRDEVHPGDALVGDGAAPIATHRLLIEPVEGEILPERERVSVHHGTRSVAGRLVRRGGGETWRLGLERPLLAAVGDRVLLRRVSPPDTIGGAVVRAVGPLTRPSDVAPTAGAAGPPVARLDADALGLEAHLRAAGPRPPRADELGAAARHLPALQAHGRAVRVGRGMYAHPEAIAAVEQIARRLIETSGPLSLAQLRDELGTSRRCAEALLGHLDSRRITRRLADDRRVLRGGRPAASTP